MADDKEIRVLPIDETVVYATDKAKFFEVGAAIAVHKAQAAKLIKDGKATEKPPKA